MSRIHLVLVFLNVSHALEQEKFAGESCVDGVLQNYAENN
jgi:hypothetical protein